MNSNKFSVVFDGQKVPDAELFGVKQRLKEVFNADRDRIETLFADKPVALKRNLSRENALKYQHMFKKKGIEVTLVQTSGVSRAEPVTPAPQEPEEPLYSLAPLGRDLSDDAEDKAQNRPSLFRTDHLGLAPQKGYILKADERKPLPTAPLNGEYGDWELNDMGEDLLKKSEKQIWQEADIDTSELDFIDTQAPLSPPAKKVVNLINTDHLELLPIEQT